MEFIFYNNRLMLFKMPGKKFNLPGSFII